MLFRVAAICLLIVSTLACDNTKSTTKKSVSDGLLYVTTDTSYSSSGISLLRYVAADDWSLETILDGQSSDLLLVGQQQQLLAINRSALQRNWRALRVQLTADSTDKFEITPGEQIAIEDAQAGDPYDLLLLGSDRALLLNYNAHELSLRRLIDGSLVSKLQTELKLGDDVVFRPAVAVQSSNASVWVAHQGLGKDFQFNHSQQLLHIQVEGDSISAIDLNPGEDGVQGIKLVGGNPVHLQENSDSSLTIVSLCNRFQTGCRSAIESFYPANNNLNTIFNLEDSNVFNFGAVIAGKDENTFYANVERLVAGTKDTYRAAVVKIDAANSAVTEVHSFSDSAISGYWGTFYDHTRDLLFVGDARDANQGRMDVYRGSERQATLDIDGIPANSGFFVTLADYAN